jgi:tetratricopeptide (TPR) repeat protein
MEMSRWTRIGLLAAVLCGLTALGVWWLQSGRPLPARSLRVEDESRGLPDAFHERVRSLNEAVRRSATRLEAVRDLARLYHANRRYVEARQYYEQLSGISGGLSPKERYLYADVLAQLGAVEEAISELEQVTQSEPAYVPAHLALGLASLKRNRPQAAARSFEKVLAIEPDHHEAVVCLARVELQEGQEPGALQRLEKHIALRPDATAAIALLAQILDRRGDSARAAALRQASHQRPEPVEPDPWMAELDTHVYDIGLLGLRFEELAQAGDQARADFFLRRVEELEPGSPLAPMLRGSVAARAQRHAEAVQQFQTSLQRGGDAEKILPVIAKSLLAMGRVDAAADLVSNGCRTHPNSLPLLIAYSEVMLARKDHPEAPAVLQRALEVQPYLVPQAFALAEILSGKGEHDAAIPYLQRVAQLDEKHFAARALLCEYHLKRGDLAAAVSWIDQALAVSPDDASIRENLVALGLTSHLLAGRRAASEGVADVAVRHLNKATELSPKDPSVHAARAQVMVQFGRIQEAIGALRDLAVLQPGNPTVFLSLGDLYRHAGNLELAMQHWREAERLVGTGDQALGAAIEARLARERSEARQ